MKINTRPQKKFFGVWFRYGADWLIYMEKRFCKPVKQLSNNILRSITEQQKCMILESL